MTRWYIISGLSAFWRKRVKNRLDKGVFALNWENKILMLKNRKYVLTYYVSVGNI